MKVEFTGRGVDVSPEVRSFTESKLERISKLVDDIKDAKVVLTVQKYRHRAEISLVSPKKTFFGEDETNDMFQTIDRVVEKLEKQARRHKDKRARSKKNTTETIRINVLSVEPADADAGAERDIKVIKSDQYLIKPMNLDEAVEELEKLGQDLVIFHEPESESMHVVYWRKDGNVGHIETTFA